MKILFVAAEAYPFIKAGGLGDVAYSLPKALRKSGMDVRVIMPRYKLPKKIKRIMKKLASYKIYIGWKTVYCSLWYLEWNGLPYYFIDNPEYFYRPNPYGYNDDDERFVCFSKAVLEGLKYMGDFKPDIMHCNDWHTALAIPLKDAYYQGNSLYDDIKTVFTIHNILYQGVYGKDTLWMLGLDEKKYYTENKLKYYDGISFMKWGIAAADKVTTVSKSYAEEIQQSWFGYGLHSVLRERKNDLHGIVNGIDYEVFNPENDKEIFNNFSREIPSGKKINKLKLQEKLGLEVNENIPIIAMVTRLTDQKGIGLLEGAMHRLMKREVQLVITGTGQEHYENALRYMENRYKGKVKVVIEFDQILSKQIYAGSDLFLMPSKFEPCGLGQLIAMRYGTVPIVRKTGGLKDTVKEYNEYTGQGNGFTFNNYSTEDMLFSIERALSFYEKKEVWNNLVNTVMNEDNTWEKSASKYKKLYERVLLAKPRKVHNVKKKNRKNKEQLLIASC
ncbi:glycogen synthase [Clostridium polyendosporum]|uniref:Glycogen synthase n=1 Tax=Clostridium polyendosporum TaxID=69208 RepID=A0A919S230_9CLOT|nr:glycogen synthase [Clostridium polyendosporum]